MGIVWNEQLGMRQHMTGKSLPALKWLLLKNLLTFVVLPGWFVQCKRAELVVKVKVAQKNSAAKSSAAVAWVILVPRTHGNEPLTGFFFAAN